MDDAYLQLGLRLLSTITGTTAAALLDTCGVELTAHNGVLDTNILHTTATYKYDGVLLKVVALTWDVGGNFLAVGEANTGNLTDSGVRLAGGLSGHLRADAALERRSVEGRAVLKRVETTGKSHDLGLGRL